MRVGTKPEGEISIAGKLVIRSELVLLVVPLTEQQFVSVAVEGKVAEPLGVLQLSVASTTAQFIPCQNRVYGSEPGLIACLTVPPELLPLSVDKGLR